MASAKKLHKLPSAAWPGANGGNIQIDLKNVPALARIRAFVFTLEGVFTTGAAAALIPGSQLFRLLSMITLGKNIRGSGYYFHLMEWLQHSCETVLPASIPATNASAFRRNVTWVIPFFDRRAVSPLDGCPAAASFGSDVISIDCAPFVGLDNATNTWNTLASITGVIRAWAVLEEPNDSPGNVAQFGYMDISGQTPNLDPGMYSDVFAFNETGVAIDSTQIITASLNADGQVLTDDLKLREYLYTWNLVQALGVNYEANSATAPVGGEELPDEPAVTAGAADTVTTPVVPFVFPANPYKLTHNVVAEKNLGIAFTGSLTSLHVGFRRVQRRQQSDIVQAMQQIGRLDITDASMVRPKTTSKSGLRPSKRNLAGFFPLRAATSRSR